MSRRRLAPLILALLAQACGGVPGERRETVSITVLAAASLTDVLTEVGAAFSATDAGVDVRFDFGPSSGLARQILDGAPAEVFASADPEAMAPVVDGGAAAGTPETFARNFLEIAVPRGNPAAVSGLADLTRSDLLIGMCAEEVPCGRLARRLLAAEGVVPAIDTDEPDVRSLLTKIESGELDAGLVYHSDVVAAGERVEGLAVPGAREMPSDYPIVPLVGAVDPEAARAFVDFVLSDAGQDILAAGGFLRRPGEQPSPPGR